LFARKSQHPSLNPFEFDGGTKPFQPKDKVHTKTYSQQLFRERYSSPCLFERFSVESAYTSSRLSITSLAAATMDYRPETNTLNIVSKAALFRDIILHHSDYLTSFSPLPEITHIDVDLENPDRNGEVWILSFENKRYGPKNELVNGCGIFLNANETQVKEKVYQAKLVDAHTVELRLPIVSPLFLTAENYFEESEMWYARELLVTRKLMQENPELNRRFIHLHFPPTFTVSNEHSRSNDAGIHDESLIDYKVSIQRTGEPYRFADNEWVLPVTADGDYILPDSKCCLTFVLTFGPSVAN
jgi:hypothetical protein